MAKKKGEAQEKQEGAINDLSEIKTQYVSSQNPSEILIQKMDALSLAT